jgi:hypothetical protein
MEEENNLDLLNKDRIWIKIKRYIYTVCVFISFLTLVLVIILILLTNILMKLSENRMMYTSSN